mgnify:FL=1
MKKKATPKTIFGIKNKFREVTHTYNNQPLIGKIIPMKKFDDKKIGYTSVVYVMESTKSVIVHFDGFKDLKECDNFSYQIMDDLGIEPISLSENITLH